MLKSDFVYFDNAATSLKPISVISKEIEYLEFYSVNSRRGDYDLGFRVDDSIDKTRSLVKEFINASDKNEIIFTSNATESLNMIVFGYFKNHLKKGDEVLLNKGEHASNILPWMILKKEIGIVIKYAPLDKNGFLRVDSIKKSITKNTKVVSLSYITNVVGDKRDIKEIGKIIHKNNAFMVVDASQSAPHIKTDVRDIDADFLVFSAHKMLGSTGVGILYGKMDLLKEMLPFKYGGGMNLDYNEVKIDLLPIPYRFEAGTLNIASIISFSEAILFLNKVGISNIERSECYLRKYLISELSKIKHVEVLNKESSSSIVLINVKGINPGDLGLYLNSKKICVRSGSHCSKMLKDETSFSDSVRISLYFYNTYEEIDRLIDALKDYSEIENFLNL